LYPRIVKEGFDVTVVRRRGYVSANASSLTYKGVTFKDINVPKVVGLESALHTLFSVFYAKRAKADLLHVHGVGPSIVLPVAKLLRLKVVVTHHGPDYNRKKWGAFARFVIKKGECYAARYADEIIAISPVICNILKEEYNRTQHVHLIYNGVNIPQQESLSTDYLESLGLSPGNYLLAVGRFVEEKNFDRLINAYEKLKDLFPHQLVIAGDSDIETAYSRELKAQAHAKGVILTGIVKGRELAELYSHAAVFVLPSSHEGLPITLLEAMSYKRKVVVSDIPANLSVQLDAACYFKLNDWQDLVDKIAAQLRTENQEKSYDLSAYDWAKIAKATIDVYKQI
jgi:glycosyltransferase involved in cell wall biosynthesis